MPGARYLETTALASPGSSSDTQGTLSRSLSMTSLCDSEASPRSLRRGTLSPLSHGPMGGDGGSMRRRYSMRINSVRMSAAGRTPVDRVFTADAIMNLVHLIQRERGVTCALLGGSRAESFAPVVRAARRDVDKVMEEQCWPAARCACLAKARASADHPLADALAGRKTSRSDAARVDAFCRAFEDYNSLMRQEIDHAFAQVKVDGYEWELGKMYATYEAFARLKVRAAASKRSAERVRARASPALPRPSL